MNATDRIPSAERLRELLDYDPETGLFTWKEKRSSRALLGQVIGAEAKNEYVRVLVDGRRCLAHRLAWLHVHGAHPRRMIDHINGNKSDNRIANLREASARVNCENHHKARKDSKSGVMGVRYTERLGKWMALIKFNGKSRCLGHYPTPEEAHAVYLECKRFLHPGFSG